MNEHAALTRDVGALADREFDLLVIGGGVHGLAAAYDAAARGLSVALVERGDFGGAASFNHQKTAHGGLRSLQTGDLRRARESVNERRALARIAPRLLRPMPFLIGTYRTLTRNRLALRVAFRIDRAVGRRRNVGVEPELGLPAPRLISRAAAERLFPGIRLERLTGGAMWYDYQIVEADRLTIGFALAAASHGATLTNHVEAVALLRNGAAVTGARVRDRLSGDEIDVRARLTLNAAGAFAGRVMGWAGIARRFALVRSMNLVTSRPAGDLALAAAGADGRMLTLIPWRGTALVGTSISAFVDPDRDEPDAGEIAALVANVNHAFPALNVTPDAVTLVHRGVVPAEPDRRGEPTLKKRADVTDHTRDGAPGLVTMIGVKYTTARAIAERAVDLAVRRLHKRGRPCRTSSDALPGASIADHEALAIETERRAGIALNPHTRDRLVSLYGARSVGIIQLAAEEAALAQPLAAETAAIGAEVVHAVRHEAARGLDDVIMRRTGLGAARWPGDEVVARASDLVARELRWKATERAAEVERLRDLYRVPRLDP